MDTTILTDLGLTQAQIDVYLTLFDLGETTTGPLIKKSKHQNSVVYNSLTQLLRKGLASFVIKGRKRYFYATDPKSLITLYEDKKETLNKLVNNLNRRKSPTNSKQESKVFLGWKGIYFAFNQILEILPNGEEYIAFGAGFEQQYTEEAKRFFREYQKKRAAMKYKIKVIVNEATRNQVENYEWYPKFGKPEFRFVQGFAPIGVIIFGDNVLNVAFEKTPVAIMNTSKQIAESYRKAFYAMWKVAKK